MTVKEKVLDFLLKADKTSVSGEDIANALGVTRSAVWKAIKSLQKEGYRIEGVRNKGYRMMEDSDRLSVVAIQNCLGEKKEKFTLEIRDEVSSTNQKLKELAERGEKEGYVLLAESQEEGRGQRGRAFYSPAHTGLYMSILLRPEMDARQAQKFTATAAVAAALSIEEIMEVSTKIKWVNDILVKGKKVCGILTEGSVSLESGLVDYLVVGIGINVYMPREKFPEEVAKTAGAICQDEKKSVRNQLAARILERFWDAYQRQDAGAVYVEYKRRSVVLGKEIMVMEGKEQRRARAVDLDEDFGLIVQFEDGHTETLCAGEVRLREEKEKEICG